ncbi:MAG: hypothetical protein D3916_09505, partial [Candidatus Electrothrix sp. MAN1_4]|nr:hypothetical protein [Candidatus Electrothrix sp. MAN1_4]
MKKTYRKSVLFSLTAAAVMAGQHSVASEQQKAVKMDEVVVSATRTEKTLADVPADVSVITKHH